jgi:hypothetical protein
MKLDITTHALPLNRFTWHRADGSLSALDSDLRNEKFDGTYRYLQRLYDDACDVGISIHSPTTDKFETFYLVRNETRDGDLLAFHFKLLDPKCVVKSVVIFND